MFAFYPHHSPIVGFSLDHAFHYSSASIDLLSGWSAIDYNTCFTATELRHYRCAKIVHMKAYTQAHTQTSPTHCFFLLFLLPFLAFISLTLQNVLQHMVLFLHSPHLHCQCFSVFIGILISSARPKDIHPHVKFHNQCFGTDCLKRRAGRAWHYEKIATQRVFPWKECLRINPLTLVHAFQFVCVRVWLKERQYVERLSSTKPWIYVFMLTW